MIACISNNKNEHNSNEYISTEKKLYSYIRQLKFLRCIANHLQKQISNNIETTKVVSEEDRNIHMVKESLSYHDICEIHSDISAVEFIVVISIIYLETFLNRKKKIT